MMIGEKPLSPVLKEEIGYFVLELIAESLNDMILAE